MFALEMCLRPWFFDAHRSKHAEKREFDSRNHTTPAWIAKRQKATSHFARGIPIWCVGNASLAVVLRFSWFKNRGKNTFLSSRMSQHPHGMQINQKRINILYEAFVFFESEIGVWPAFSLRAVKKQPKNNADGSKIASTAARNATSFFGQKILMKNFMCAWGSKGPTTARNKNN